MDNNNRRFGGPQIPSEFSEEVVQVNRVSKKTKGGNKINFAVLTVVGDKKGKVGMGMGKAADVAAAIRKSVSAAKKNFVLVPLFNGTIPFSINIKVKSARIMLKPAPKGSGIIAGGAVRSVVTAAGIENISSKVLGSNNQINNVHATIEALKLIGKLHYKNKGMKK